jgi:hypothetical protein
VEGSRSWREGGEHLLREGGRKPSINEGRRRSVKGGKLFVKGGDRSSKEGGGCSNTQEDRSSRERRPFVNGKRSSIEGGRPSVERGKPFAEGGKPFVEGGRPFVEGRGETVRRWRGRLFMGEGRSSGEGCLSREGRSSREAVRREGAFVRLFVAGRGRSSREGGGRSLGESHSLRKLEADHRGRGETIRREKGRLSMLWEGRMAVRREKANRREGPFIKGGGDYSSREGPFVDVVGGKNGRSSGEGDSSRRAVHRGRGRLFVERGAVCRCCGREEQPFVGRRPFIERRPFVERGR